MAEQSHMNKVDEAARNNVIAKFMAADLLAAAEAFGADLGPEEKAALDMSICSEKKFLKKVLNIAKITGDKRLAENLRTRLKYPKLRYNLPPATQSILEIYAERFYSYWQDEKQFFIRTEISDFPQWYNTAREKADEIFIAEALENILVMSCAKERASKAPLLRKLLDNIIDAETIRLGYLYPDRDMAHRVLSDFCQRLKELLLIRELHDSSLQLGEHPEELIPYVWSNILKNLLNQKFAEALDNINAQSYLHYAAEKTESLIGTAAYAELKKGLCLFDEGKQCTWPNEIRKMFLDPTLVEALMRYRFTHGLMAVNTALAFRLAEKKDDAYLDPRDEDAVVLNGLLLTQTGYIRSPGFKDTTVREEFLKNVNYFKSLKRVFESRTRDKFFLWHKKMKSKCERLEAQLLFGIRKIDSLVEEKSQMIKSKEDGDIGSRAITGKGNRSFIKRLWKDTNTNNHQAESEKLGAEIEKDKKELADLIKIRKTQEEVVSILKILY